jgi:putative GTP pyrophosphokinase
MPSLMFDDEEAAFRNFYNDNQQHLAEAKDAFLALLRSITAQAGIPIAAASGRIKDRDESIKKFTRKYQGDLERTETPYEIKDYITDLIGLRLVCLYEDEVERVGELVRPHFKVIDVTDKTAEVEGTENLFGYKGLHLDLRLNEEHAAVPFYQPFADYRFELQIRTVVQDSWSTLDHKIKYKRSIPASLKRRINTLAALFELADREFRQVRDETDREIELAKAEAAPVGAVDDQGHEVAAEVVEPSTPTDAIERGQYAPLNSFRLLRIAHHFYPDFDFEPRKVDGFTAEVVALEPGISRGKFNVYLRETIKLVRRYKADFLASGRSEKFNPFTEMRHALYAANPAVFGAMLTKIARQSFDDWRMTDGANDTD